MFRGCLRIPVRVQLTVKMRAVSAERRVKEAGSPLLVGTKMLTSSGCMHAGLVAETEAKRTLQIPTI